MFLYAGMEFFHTWVNILQGYAHSACSVLKVVHWQCTWSSIIKQVISIETVEKSGHKLTFVKKVLSIVSQTCTHIKYCCELGFILSARSFKSLYLSAILTCQLCGRFNDSYFDAYCWRKQYAYIGRWIQRTCLVLNTSAGD